MDKSNLELFKQAVNEGLSNKFDSIVQGCTEEITYSDRHKIAMQTLVYGKTNNRRTLSPKMRRIIAILVAAALLLTGCGIIFRNEIRDIVEDIHDLFVSITYTDSDYEGKEIADIYELTYVPEGYSLNYTRTTPISVRYEYIDDNNNSLSFLQKALDGTYIIFDSEDGQINIEYIQDREIYCKYADNLYNYVWNDGKYTLIIMSSAKLSNEEIAMIIDGIKY